MRDPKKLQAILKQERRKGRSIGFIPTMGALHGGHLSLVRAANRENDVTVVSIFVNPKQFGPKEDYAKYPRALGTDRKLLQPLKVDYLFCPTVRGIYPRGDGSLPAPPPLTGSRPTAEKADSSLSRRLCGKFRPGHFRGVMIVITKLLDIIGPCRLYLGAKDYQQTAVLGRLVRDLGLAVRIRMMPTVREKDGLAMSSRNQYLSPEERRRARAIPKALKKFRQDLLNRKGTIASLKARAIRELKRIVDRVQYFEIVDPVTLMPVTKRRREMAALTACFVGKTRLIDNVIIRASRQ